LLPSLHFSFASSAQKARPPTLHGPHLLPHLHQSCRTAAAAKAINHGSSCHGFLRKRSVGGRHGQRSDPSAGASGGGAAHAAAPPRPGAARP
ncbi:hypothetical protein BAE44_0024904, partial [Dichanthelium oligosanthes]